MAQSRASASTVRAGLLEARKAWGWTPSEIIGLLRGGGSSSKGSTYERDVCRRLSLWWTADARDDVFWRSSGSGARAKVRGRAGADTAGQHGDVAATDPIGAPLIDMFTIELKRGYNEHTFQDLVDRPHKAGVQEWERFIAQTIESWEQAGSYAWMMVTRRDRRQDLVWLPYHAIQELREEGAFANGRPVPFIRMSVSVRGCGQVSRRVELCGMTLDDMLAGVAPAHVIDTSRRV